jgi:hypothetical protein
MTNHLFKKISDAIEGRESRLFRETPAGFALAYTGMIKLSGRYAEALAELGQARRWRRRLGVTADAGVGQLRTAWLDRLRRAMVRPGRDRLAREGHRPIGKFALSG